VALHKGLEIPVVTATDNAGEGNAAGADRFHDEAFALLKAPVSEGEASDSVIAMDIDPGIVKDKVGRAAIEELGQDLGEAGKVVPVAGPFRQLDVPIGGLALDGKILFAVKGKSEHGRILPENEVGPVALVDVEINDEDFSDSSLMPQLAGGDGDVVVDAEARAVSREGVMGAAGGVAAETVAKGEPGREEGSTNGDVCSADEIWRPGQADPAERPGLNLVVAESLHVIRLMGPQEDPILKRSRTAEIVPGGDSFLQEAGVQRLELFHWKAMPGRQPAVVIRMVDKGNPHVGSEARWTSIANRARYCCGHGFEPDNG